MDTYNEDEKIQLAWMATHYITNKDKEAEVQNFSALQSHRKQEKKKSQRNPAAWNLPLPEQELDLHGFTIEEAIAAIEEMFLAMQLAKMSVLRLIHGGGHPSSGLIKKAIDQKVRSEWKGKVRFYGTEPNNAGSSIIQLLKTETIPKKFKKP